MSQGNMKGLKPDHTKNVVTESEEQEQSSLGKRLGAMRDKLKLGPHHKMERFTVLLGGTTAFLLLFCVLSFVTHRADIAKNVSAQAVYTENFKFSLSDEKMYVEGVFGNKEKTDVMVLLRIQNPETMSADASNYELFVTGEKDSLSYKPKMTFSLFGSTGYGLIRFQHKSQIPKELVDITIRSNAELSAREASEAEGDVADGSFQKYDQGRLIVNPGADSVKTLDWLKEDETDPTKLYTALVAETFDDEIHEEIKKQTDELKQLLNREKEYTNRLASAGFEAPTSPWFVKGDYVNEDGALVAAENLPGAFEVDYVTKTIRDGYLNQVMGDLSGFDAYMKEHEVAKEAVKKDSKKKEQVERVESLKGDDGERLDLNTVTTGTSPSAQVAAKSSVESLQATWRTYLNTKSKLQRDQMRRLLVLDADVQSQKHSYSVNDDKSSIRFY